MTIWQNVKVHPQKVNTLPSNIIFVGLFLIMHIRLPLIIMTHVIR